MYLNMKNRLVKHLDFLILDVLLMELVFSLCIIIRHSADYFFQDNVYKLLLLIVFFSSITISIANDTYRNVIKRDYYKEFRATLQYVFGVWLTVILYLYIVKKTELYSRFVLITFLMAAIVACYLGRILLKFLVRKRLTNTKNLRMMVLVTTEEKARDLILQFRENAYRDFIVRGVVLDKNPNHIRNVLDMPVMGSMDEATNLFKNAVVDEVFFDLPRDVEVDKKFYRECLAMGITIHESLFNKREYDNENVILEYIGGHTVLTQSVKVMTVGQQLLKRLMDILGGIVGVFFTVLLTPFVVIAIRRVDKGPIFFKQKRVGRNGREFEVYKFRSMYMDAEERKKDLLEKNKVKDNHMFKMDFDPRVLGNYIDENGEEHRGIGDFIRKTSIDEFPQFLNVLKGEMSLVGTRPPTVDEVAMYENHHKGRLATKPGITGLWQVSGRSKITDFEEVVRLDTKYISEWTFGLDLKILFKTVMVVFKGEGAV